MKKFLKTITILALLAAASAAQADLNRVGPTNNPSPPGNGFPAWYQDLNGLTLDICLPTGADAGQLQQTACLLTGAGLPNPPYVFPTNYPDEIFYYRAVSAPLDTSFPEGTGTNRAVLVLALEAAFASGGPVAGQQITFSRIRVTAGLSRPGTWTVNHPYGSDTFVVDNVTGARDIFFSEDVGVTAGVFTGALSSRVGPFLQATDALGAVKPPVTLNGAQFLSDGVALETITPGPFGTAVFELCGPYDGVTTTCRSTPFFTLTGRVHVGAVPSPLAIERASYSRSGGVAQVDVTATAVPALGQAAPKLSAAADTVAPVLLAGPTVLGQFYGQGIPVPANAIPSLLTVINSADVPPTAVTTKLTDLVSIKSATYAAGTLTVVATTSDKGSPAAVPPVPPADLSLDGFPLAVATVANPADAAEHTFTVSALTVPPGFVSVSSSVGGQATADVIMGAAPAFPPGVPLAVNDTALATAGDPAVVIDVLLNDVQSSLAPVLPVTIVTPPAAGTAVANLDGTVSYTPGTAAGTATFAYTVRNAAGTSNVATVTVTVSPSLNPVPIAVNDPTVGSVSLAANQSTVIDVLANDSGNGGILNPASVLVTALTGGTVSVNPATGAVTFTAGTVAGATFGFNYTVANTNGQVSNSARVSITVTNPEAIGVKGAQCQNAGTQWVVSGTSTVQTGTLTLYRVSPVPVAPTPAQTIASVPIVAGKWSYNVRGGPACANPISVRSTNGGVLNNIAVQIK